MRTLEQILEGVTAGGQWRRRPFGFEVQVDNGEEMAPVIMSTQNPADAAYAARAARNFPALVRALEAIHEHGKPHGQKCVCAKCVAWLDSRAVLAAALKD